MRDPIADRSIEPVKPPVPVKPIAPKPPPAGLDPVKWALLSRAERRALLRHHRKATGER